MPTNHNHYNLQSLRGYPLADSASTVDDSGAFLPADILVDCRLRFPNTAGQYAFLAGVTVTSRLVTLVILAADSPTAVSGFTPLASISLPQPVVAGQHYAVSPLYPGVGGWVVFGAGIAVPFTGRFASPTQSLLASHCSTPSRPLPIPSVGKLGLAASLTGLVEIVGGTDIAVVKEQIMVEGNLRDALVIRLESPITTENVLEKYLPECGGRPESGTCLLPGIEFINGVRPDCDGNLAIVFEELEVAPYSDLGPGVTIDHGMNIEEVCQPSAQQDGYVDACEAALSSESSAAPSSESSVVPPDPSSESVPCSGLPVLLPFDSATPAMVVQNGEFVYLTDADFDEVPSSESSYASAMPPETTYVALSGSVRNISIWDDCGAQPTADKRVSCDVRVMGTNPSRNGGLVLNYHLADPLTDPHIAYFLVLLDLNLNKLRVLRYNGFNHVEEYASPAALPLVAERRYRLVVDVIEISPVSHTLSVELRDAETMTLIEAFDLGTSRYGDTADGYFGVGSVRGNARFGFLQIEELP